MGEAYCADVYAEIKGCYEILRSDDMVCQPLPETSVQKEKGVYV